MNSTPFYAAPTLPPSPNPQTTALPVPFADMISVPGPHTLHLNKLLFCSALLPLSSFANTTKHGPTLHPIMYTTHLLRSIPLSQTPTLILSRARTIPPLLPCQPTTRGYPKCQVCQSPFDEKKLLLCDIFNAGSHINFLLPPLTTIPAGMWKCPSSCVHPLLPQTRVRCDTSAFTCTCLTLILIEHRHYTAWGKGNKKSPLSLFNNDYFQP